MKIRIKTKDTRLRLWIPNCLLTNTTIWRMVIDKTVKKDLPLTKDQMKLILKACQRCVKDNKGLLLVDIQTKEQEIVRIKL